MKTLHLVSSAYRATLEEQDDTVIWLMRAMRAAGARLDVVLLGNAVNYAVARQNASGLRLGEWQQAHPPCLADDVAALARSDASVFIVQEDIVARGLDASELVEGVTPIARAALAPLFSDYDRVCHW